MVNTSLDKLLSPIPPISPSQLGDESFCKFHNTKYAYYAGSMANGISSERFVIALGKEKILSSFGAGGLEPARVESAIITIKNTLPEGPYAFNLIHSPNEPTLEQEIVNLYLRHNVRTVEASAFLDLTPGIVYYRVSGLSPGPDNQVQINNRVIAKISRREVAVKFLQPAPAAILSELLQQGKITPQQAELAETAPMADDVTVEADSGGHTDNRPLVCLLPSILWLRDEVQAKYNYRNIVRIGAAGGIGTPEAALAAFVMGAAYIVTGSVNQCVESGASEHVRKLLAKADMADVIMAPAPDMFEMGARMQVLKRGTMFPLRAQKLYDLYNTHGSLDDIPTDERTKLEKQIFKNDLETIWEETKAFFMQRDPELIRRAEGNPKRKMALVFRWYLGLSSTWANQGKKGREIDYQIWCGPAMGAFNDWVRGSYLENPDNRKAADIAEHIMRGAAFLYRIQIAKLQGIQIPPSQARYVPTVFS